MRGSGVKGDKDRREWANRKDRWSKQEKKLNGEKEQGVKVEELKEEEEEEKGEIKGEEEAIIEMEREMRRRGDGKGEGI